MFLKNMKCVIPPPKKKISFSDIEIDIVFANRMYEELCRILRIYHWYFLCSRNRTVTYQALWLFSEFR